VAASAEACPIAEVPPAPLTSGEVPPAWLAGVPGFTQGVERQRTTRAPLLLYFYTDWCGYCRQVERDIFSLPDFDRTLGQTNIRVRVNPEAAWRTAGWPTASG
jgi:thiol-disulfide isomerase/thioredoxin